VIGTTSVSATRNAPAPTNHARNGSTVNNAARG
jgi:hypothetical protein